MARYAFCMASDRVRKDARNHPEAFRRIAERAEGQLGDHLMRVYQEERQNAKATVSAD